MKSLGESLRAERVIERFTSTTCSENFLHVAFSFIILFINGKINHIIFFLIKLNSKFPIITSLGTYQNGVIDLHDAKIIYGVYPLHAFIPDTSSGGYKVDIDLSDYGFTGEMWASVTPRYPIGHPYVSIASVSASKVTLLSDVNVSGAYAQWSVIGKTN